MNDKIGPTDNELLNYLSWCEAVEIPPFEEDNKEETKEEENEEIENINILTKKRKDD